jgi:outer membrane receptor protein involved in Fe transport
MASAAVGLAICTPAYAQGVPNSAQTEVSQGTSASNAGTNNAPTDAIIVTAQKRVEVLAKVPQSVTVVGEQTLDRQQATNLQDYLALVPGLSLEGSTRGVSRITLRGINTGGVASTVGVYVDDVPFGSSSGLANGAILAGDFDTFDVARLEVLRGPQGTLYGASSLGGVLKFVTNAPNSRGFEGRAEFGIEDLKGGGIGYSGTGMVNVPLSGRAAIRATGFYRKEGGFIDSIGNNPLPDLVSPTPIFAGTRVDKDLNDVKTYGGRISGLFNATDNLSVRLGAIFQNINNAGSDYVEVDPVTFEPLYGDVTQSRYFPEWTHVKYRIYSGVADWNFGFANLTSSTSYGRFSETFQRDWTLAQLAPGLPPLAQLLSLDPDFGGFFGQPLGAVLRQQTATDKFTQEFRLASPDNDKFEWLVGAYYTHEKSHIDPQNAYAVDAVTGQIPSDIPTLYAIFLRSKYREYAAFANGTIHFTPQFDLTLGGRVSKNKQSAAEQITGALIGGAVINYPDLASKESVATYSIAPRYEINDNTSVYARVATGYRPGGPNALPPNAPDNLRSYKSDRLTSYEAGLKADWFNRKLSLDVAAFYLDWTDIQLYQLIDDQWGVNANGGTAVSKGFEFTVAARPMRGLNLSLNGAYTDAYLTKETDPAIGGQDGDPLPYIPDWNLNLNADYEWPVFSDWNGFVGGSISYTGDRTPEFDVRDADGDLVKLPSYTTIDLRAGMESERWLAELYVKNLTNKRGITSVLTLDPGNYPNDAGAVGIIRPRTIGFTVGARFH